MLTVTRNKNYFIVQNKETQKIYGRYIDEKKAIQHMKLLNMEDEYIDMSDVFECMVCGLPHQMSMIERQCEECNNMICCECELDFLICNDCFHLKFHPK